MKLTLKAAFASFVSVAAIASASAQETDPADAVDLAHFCATDESASETSCARIDRLAEKVDLSLFQAPDMRALLPADVLDGRTLLRVVFPGRTFFNFDAASLRAEGEAAVETIAEELKTNDDTILIIAGHADNRGPAEYNQTLSQRRAEATADALQARGVGDVDIRVVGYGESAPLIPNATGAQHGFNRRVEFIFASTGAGATGTLVAAEDEGGAAALAAAAAGAGAAEAADETGDETGDGAAAAAGAAATGGFLALFSPRVEAAYTFFEMDEPEFHAAGGRLGLDIGELFGVEAEYFSPLNEDFTSTKTGFFLGEERQIVATELRSQWGAYALANFPLSDKVSAFMRAGYSEFRITRDFVGQEDQPRCDYYEGYCYDVLAAVNEPSAGVTDMQPGDGPPTFQNFETELTGGFAFGGGFRGRIGNSGLGWRVDYTRIDLDGKIADAYSGALTFNF